MWCFIPETDGPLVRFPPPVIPGVLRLTFPDDPGVICDIDVVSPRFVSICVYSKHRGYQRSVPITSDDPIFAPNLAQEGQCSIHDRVADVFCNLGIARR